MSTPKRSEGTLRSKKTAYIPVAALKRFANELESDLDSNKFLQINRDRVNEFIEKNPIAEFERKNELRTPTSPRKVPGVYEYPEKKPTQSLLKYQNQPEFQGSLGFRSRFGEGDGSFFDHWLNSDTARSKHLHDKDGLPLMSFSLSQSRTGFKRHLNDFKAGKVESERTTGLQSYADRRRERLVREEQQKLLLSNSKPQHKDTDEEDVNQVYLDDFLRSGLDNSPFSPAKPTKTQEFSNEPKTEIPPEEASLVAKKNYFGEDARSSFFEYYRQLSRQSYAIGSTPHTQDYGQHLIPSRNARKSGGSSRGREVLLAEMKSRGDSISPTKKIGTASLENDGSLTLSRGQSFADKKLSPDKDEATRRILEIQQKSEEEREVLLQHLSRLPTDALSPDRPYSARTTFLSGCVSSGIVPQPALIIRKELTTTLNISLLAIGDKLAQLLAQCLENLPLLEGLCVADNNLTDQGLVPVVEALERCANLRSLDISCNKVDSASADALNKFLSSEQCVLVELIMRNANVDDYEAARFMQAIAVRHTVKLIDLSENLLGSHEVNLTRSSETAGEAIGRLLEDPRCCVETLKLAWNMIRFNSGIVLVTALKRNKTLKYLDLSYNGLGIEGGEALGDALQDNKSLVHLKVAHNNLTSRPCMTILSGVLTCTSIRELDLCENPIGEVGAKMLLGINIHHGDRLAVDFRGCSVRVKDPSCWYNGSTLHHDLVLHLDQPYERCVCIELLRELSKKNIELLQMFRYHQAADDTTGRDLNLQLYEGVVQSDRRKSGIIRTDSKIMDMNEPFEVFQETAHKIFQHYDVDQSGALDRDELALVLDQMGLKDPKTTAEKLLSIYDVDGSGLVEVDEFVNFLTDIKTTYDEEQASQVRRYVFDRDAAPKEGPPPVYIPPDKGHVRIIVSSSEAVAEWVQPISKSNIDAMLSSSKGVADSTAIFDYALGVMKLSFVEAKSFYRVMVKDLGSPHQVVLRLLPRMASATDARMLISHATNNDFLQIHALTQALGNLHRVYIGLPDGFYRLNLAEDTDKMCLKRLLELSDAVEVKRRRQGQGDTSQDGNWMSFRNVVFEGKPMVFTRDWLKAPPEKGRLDFDFVSLGGEGMRESEISDLRLFRLMVGLGMVEEVKRTRVFTKLKLTRDEGREVSKGSGVRRWEFQATAAEEISVILQQLYDRRRSGRKPLEFPSVSNTEAIFLDGKRRSLQKDTAGRVDTRRRAQTPLEFGDDFAEKMVEMQKEIANPTQGTGEAREVKSKSKRRKLKSKNASERVDKHEEEGAENTGDDIKGIESLSNQNCIREMMESNMLEPSVIAMRVLETLQMILAGRFLTSGQLALLVEKFPDGAERMNEFSTFRVELVIMFFSRVKDVINFDYVLKELDHGECAMLFLRLGWLNLWNPIKPEGCLCLDLSRREERQVIRMLIVLMFLETGETWEDVVFRKDRTSEPERNFNLPVTWFSEATLPTEGLLSLKYFSGKGKFVHSCAVDVTTRFSLMSLVLASPYPEDTMTAGNKLNITLADTLLDSIGCQLSFITEKQIELKGK